MADKSTLGYAPALETCSVAQADHIAMFESSSGARTLFASSLQVVLRGVIEHIVYSSKP